MTFVRSQTETRRAAEMHVAGEVHAQPSDAGARFVVRLPSAIR